MEGSVVYGSPWVPSELIWACGMTPSRVMPLSTASSGPIGPVAGVCPYARAFLNTAVADESASGIILTTVCDQMRRVADIAVSATSTPVFVLNVPHTHHEASLRLYASELERLGRWLVRLGGNAPTPAALKAAMLAHDSLHAEDPSNQTLPGSGGIPIALVGGPMMADRLEVFDLVESAGGTVALDATETGERGLPAPFDWETSGSPLSVLARAYFHGIADPFQRPNTHFYEWLGERLAERRIRGIILRRYLWCDIWHAEAQRIEDTFGLPLLHLDIGDSGVDAARTAARVQAFMEVLR